MSLTGHRMPPRTTQQSHRPRVSDRTMVGTLPPRCLQALPHGTKNAATEGPGYRATPRSTTEPHRGWMSDTYLLHLHAEGEKCFLLTSPFIESVRRRPGETTHLVPIGTALVAQAHAHTPPVGCVLADAEFDSERNHTFVRQQLHALSIIPLNAGQRRGPFMASELKCDRFPQAEILSSCVD